MTRKKNRKAAELNARQRAFVRHYVSGTDGVRGNASQAYVAAGYSPRGANKLAARLMANDGIRKAIEASHRRAEQAAATKLRDWKQLAGAAQERLVAIAEGRMPEPTPAAGDGGTKEKPADDEAPRRIGDRDDAAAAKVILDANLEIIERAQPKKLMLELDDPAGVLANLLGVKPEAVPTEEG